MGASGRCVLWCLGGSPSGGNILVQKLFCLGVSGAGFRLWWGGGVRFSVSVFGGVTCLLLSSVTFMCFYACGVVVARAIRWGWGGRVVLVFVGVGSWGDGGGRVGRGARAGLRDVGE